MGQILKKVYLLKKRVKWVKIWRKYIYKYTNTVRGIPHLLMKVYFPKLCFLKVHGVHQMTDFFQISSFIIFGLEHILEMTDFFQTMTSHMVACQDYTCPVEVVRASRDSIPYDSNPHETVSVAADRILKQSWLYEDQHYFFLYLETRQKQVVVLPPF